MALTENPQAANITPELAEQLDRLDRQAAERGWSLSTTNGQDPDSQISIADQIVGAHVLVMPAALASRRRVGIVSSRIGRSFDQLPAWFRALRSAVAGINERTDVLVTAPNTATAEFVERAALLFGRCVMTLQLPPATESIQNWIGHAAAHVSSPPKSRQSLALISPSLGRSADSVPKIPLRDRALFGICDQIVALHVRSRSFTLQLLEHRLQQRSSSHSQTQVALGRGLVAPKLRDRLLDQGAVGRAFLDELPPAVDVHDGSTHEWSIESVLADDGQWPYLTHCTRRRRGPWPDQTHREFLDDLILKREAAQHSALDSLRYILQTKRLVASAESVQGTQDVICLTAVPLPELKRLRVFRPHRGRWDFEPYGICIQRPYLEQRGAFPVRYVTDVTGGAHDGAHDGAVEQRAVSRTKSGNTLDWTVEQEWRYLGDLALDQIPADAAFVFVPSEVEAIAIQPLSPWPVVVLPPTVER